MTCNVYVWVALPTASPRGRVRKNCIYRDLGNNFGSVIAGSHLRIRYRAAILRKTCKPQDPCSSSVSSSQELLSSLSMILTGGCCRYSASSRKALDNVDRSVGFPHVCLKLERNGSAGLSLHISGDAMKLKSTSLSICKSGGNLLPAAFIPNIMEAIEWKLRRSRSICNRLNKYRSG